MPTLQWALICSRAITDKETNSISYIDAIEQIVVQKFPFSLPPICISMLWRSESSEDLLIMRIRLEDPSGEEIQSFEPESIKLLKKRHRFTVVIGGYKISTEGECKLIIEKKEKESENEWKHVKSLPIDISEIELNQAAQQENT